MQIQKTQEDAALTLSLRGRLDTIAAQSLESALKSSLDGIDRLILDCAELAYISSAGLRVLLFAQKQMSKHGGMTLRNVSPGIMEVFEITGFSGILTVE